MSELPKRRWHYTQQPRTFEIAPCSCGNANTQWSEFEKHLWCDKCQKDFIPEHNGVFDGPICINIAGLLGFNFDRFNLETNQIEVLDKDKCEYLPR